MENRKGKIKGKGREGRKGGVIKRKKKEGKKKMREQTDRKRKGNGKLKT